MNCNAGNLMLKSVVAAALVLAGGCTQRTSLTDYALGDRGHRLIRISFRSQRATFRVRINNGPIQKLPNSSFTNTVSGFQLEYGDIVVWEAVRDQGGAERSWPKGISQWWSHYLKDTRAAHYCINSECIQDFFRTSLYSWKAPFRKPRPVASADFFCDGQCLGRGASGLCAMLDSIQTNKKPVAPFLLAPRIKNESDWDMEQLGPWLREAGLEKKYQGKLCPSEIGDAEFGRMMDEQ